MSRVLVLGGAGACFITEEEQSRSFSDVLLGYSWKLLPGGAGLDRARALKLTGMDVEARLFTGTDGASAHALSLASDWGLKVVQVEGVAPLYMFSPCLRKVFPSVLNELEAGEVKLEGLKGGALLSTLDLPVEFLEAVFKKAQEKSVKVFLRVSPYKKNINELLKYTNHLLLSREVLWKITGTGCHHYITAAVTAKKLLKKPVESVVVNLGRLGSVVVTEDTWYRVVPKPAAEGYLSEAAFDAYYVWAVTSGKSFEEALKIAGNAYILAGRENDPSALPSKEEVESYSPPPVSKELRKLLKKSSELRLIAYELLVKAGSGHPAGSFSMMELVTAMFYKHINWPIGQKDWNKRDRVIFSKGHGIPAFYAFLIEKGVISATTPLRRLDSPLQGHPDRVRLPYVEMTTGSLGQGLSVAVGLARGLKNRGEKAKVYVILGDGEVQEGQIWEAAMSAASLKLDNLCVIVDYNGLQIDGALCEVKAATEPIADKFRAFGWEVVEIDGHDISEILWALEKFVRAEGAPFAIIAHTVKGKGVSFMEHSAEYHGKTPKGELAMKGLEELKKALAELEAGDEGG